MKSVFYITILAVSLSVSFLSCKERKKTEEDIIVEKVVAKPQSEPGRMERDERNGSVTWIGGAEYSYSIVRATDNSLPVVENHGRKYHDNNIQLSVYRADGTVFFQKTFTKENFSPILPSQFKEHGVLLGMNLDKAEGNNLRFIVSVGSPDDSNEEFYYVVMKLSNFGATSAERYEGMEVE